MFGFKKSGPARGVAYPATAYRLRAWPELPESSRTAAVYRAFSRMSMGPVTMPWFMSQTGMPGPAAARLFDQLVGDGKVEMIDLDRFQAPPTDYFPAVGSRQPAMQF